MFKKNKITADVRTIKTKGKIGKMKLSVIILMSYRNIAANKVRSFLTIGGVSVGIGIITFLIALGFGVQDMVIKEIIKKNPANIIDVTNGNLENFVVLNNDVMTKIKAIDGVDKVERSVELGAKFYNNDSQADAVLDGVTKEYMGMANIRLSSGNLDFADSDPKVLITPKLAQLLGFQNPSDAIGKQIKYQVVLAKEIIDRDMKDENLDKRDVTVEGIINDDDNNNKTTAAYTMMGYLKNDYGVVAGQEGKVSAKNGANIDMVRSKIEQMGFTTGSVTDTISDINSFFNIVRTVLVVFGTIIMSISAMGMLNTLSVSLLQRTKEVGILKALGAKRKDIFKMFILEAAIISFSGGIIGFSGGYGLARLVNWTFNIIARHRGMPAAEFIQMPSYFIFAVAIFIAFLGFATGIMPAVRASKTHALDALRYE